MLLVTLVTLAIIATGGAILAWIVSRQIRKGLGVSAGTPAVTAPAKTVGLHRSSVVAIIMNLLVFVPAFMVMVADTGNMNWQGLSHFNWATIGVTTLVVQLFYTFDALTMLRLDEQGILLVFGRYLRDVPPGLVYVPRWICTLVRAPTGIIENDLPADPRRIWHGDATKGDGKIPKGYFPPVRVTFAPKPEEKVVVMLPNGKERTIPEDDPYLQRNNAEVEGSYGWYITDLRRLAFRLGTKNTIEKAQNQMDDVAIGTFNNIFSQLTPAEAQIHLKETSDEVRNALSQETQDWGITVAFFRMKPFGFSHELNAEVSKAAESFPKKAAMIRLSEGELAKRTNEGRGTANAQGAMYDVKVKADRAFAEIAATPGGQFALAMQTQGEALGSANLVVVPQDNIMGSIAGATKLIKQMSVEAPPASPKTEENPL